MTTLFDRYLEILDELKIIEERFRNGFSITPEQILAEQDQFDTYTLNRAELVVILTSLIEVLEKNDRERFEKIEPQLYQLQELLLVH